MIGPDAVLLRLHVNSNDRAEGKPLYRAVVERARTLGLAGASVFNVEAAYGAHRRLHDASNEYGFADIPVVIEIVDEPARIDAFLADVAPMIREGLITTRPVRVARYVHPDRSQGAGG